ncbi:hypothetical protein GCM10011408_41200 [Dyella caseinilytica]|nr:hypothetical protein GCM10011408_41200 [Dyella caseinilytica]
MHLQSAEMKVSIIPIANKKGPAEAGPFIISNPSPVLLQPRIEFRDAILTHTDTVLDIRNGRIRPTA